MLMLYNHGSVAFESTFLRSIFNGWLGPGSLIIRKFDDKSDVKAFVIMASCIFVVIMDGMQDRHYSI